MRTRARRERGVVAAVWKVRSVSRDSQSRSVAGALVPLPAFRLVCCYDRSREGGRSGKFSRARGSTRHAHTDGRAASLGACTSVISQSPSLSLCSTSSMHATRYHVSTPPRIIGTGARAAKAACTHNYACQLPATPSKRTTMTPHSRPLCVLLSGRTRPRIVNHLIGPRILASLMERRPFSNVLYPIWSR